MKNFLLLCLLFGYFGLFSQRNTNGKALSATQSFLNTLDVEKRSKAFFLMIQTNEGVGFLSRLKEKDCL